MKLTYRGIPYEIAPSPVAATETESTGKYRGIDVKFSSAHPSSLVRPYRLSYRGSQHIGLQ